MAELNRPNYGRNKILMFRLLSEADQKDAAKLALQTEHTWSYERSADQTQTKDGPVNASGGLSVTLDITAISSKDAVNEMLKQSVIDGETLEVWEIDLASKTSDNKYSALYARGNLSTWEVPSNVEDLETISTSMSIEGKPQAGEATLSAEHLAEIEAAYTFQDTTKQSATE